MSMADEGSENRLNNMDLNLYLGLPRSPRPRSLDLGSDLALSSIPISISSNSEESRAIEPVSAAAPVEASASNASEEDVLLACFPSYEADLPIEQEIVEVEERDEGSPINIVDVSEDSGSLPPYSSPFGSFSSIPLQIGGSSSQQELLRSPEFRLQRLIESHQYRFRRFSRSNETSPTELMQDIMNSQRSLETSGKHKEEGAEEDADAKNKCVANFECNICFDMAKDPVVTSCGHLFCWSCLYQWLHVHSDNKECPVCKGEVTEENVVPIYGRGSSGLDGEKLEASNLDHDLKIPPRPRGNRLESWRQSVRPSARRFGDVANWRRFLSQQMRSSRSRLGGNEDGFVQEMLNGGAHPVVTRSMARRMHREEGANVESSVFQEGNDIWQRLYGFPISERLAAVTADIGRAVGRFAGGGSRFGGSSSSVNATNVERVSRRGNVNGDQGSVSSTVAVIQGESSAGGGSAEPNSGGSSRANRRRGRSSGSGSSGVEGGGGLHSRKRRRVNE